MARMRIFAPDALSAPVVVDLEHTLTGRTRVWYGYRPDDLETLVANRA